MRGNDDLSGQLGDLLRYGSVQSVDLAGARCVVAAGDVATGPIRWIEGAAGATRSWSPPSVGEQVLLLCPEGDIEGAIALRGISSGTFPPAGNGPREIIRSFADGTVLAYDPEAHRLELLAGSGSLMIVATGGISIQGDITLTGKLTASGDVTAAGISLKSHKHGGVQSGGAKTALPE